MGKKMSWYLERLLKYYLTKPNYKKEYGSFKKYCELKVKYDRAKRPA